MINLIIFLCTITVTAFAQMNVGELSHQLALLGIKIDNPDRYLGKNGPLVVLGNASMSDADILILPEVHDDAESLLHQMLIISNEAKKNPQLIVLDESLDSLKKSSWDFFSQKSLEVLTARLHRSGGKPYSPRRFEQELGAMAKILQKIPGELEKDPQTGLWSFKSIEKNPLSFFGWDTKDNRTMINRNQSFIKSTEQVLKTHPKVIVMMGARHVPELEFYTSRPLLCDGQKITSTDEYFKRIENRFGESKDLPFGIGSSAGIHQYLSHKKYAIVFEKPFYDELNKVMVDFRKQHGVKSCLSL